MQPILLGQGGTTSARLVIPVNHNSPKQFKPVSKPSRICETTAAPIHTSWYEWKHLGANKETVGLWRDHAKGEHTGS